MQFPLLIELRRSRRLGFLLLAFHVAAMLSALVSLLPRDDLPYRFSILALLLAPIRRKQLAENARHKAVQRYGWDAIALEYEQLFTEVTAKGAGGVVQPSSQSAAGY